MAPIHLTMLGPFRARLTSEHLVDLMGKPAALLAYLALRPRRTYPRDVLAALLWGDSEEEHARHSLRQALTALRQRLSGGAPALLVAGGETIALNPAAVEVDVAVFERLVASRDIADLTAAAALYQGDFLEGFRSTEGPFEEWLLTERERLRGVVVGVLAKLLAHQTDAWQDELAVQTAGRLLVLDPFREAAHRTLMRLYGRQGRREDALRQYHACVAMLERELGAGPEAETRRLYEQLRQQPASRERRLTELPAAPIFDPTKRLLGERKRVTVLCADLTTGARLSALRDSGEAHSPLEPILRQMLEAVRRYEGTVTHVKRDGLTALFGVPFAQEDHAVRACYAAQRMQHAVARYASDVFGPRGRGVQMRAGVHSGEVVVHSIGADLRMEYTPIGETTIFADSMKQLAPGGVIRISAETMRLSGGLVQGTPIGRKPFEELAEVYEVVAIDPAGSRFEVAASRGLSPFVGRDTEVAQLVAALDRAQRGRGEIVAVVGEPGVGKSRLIHEFTRSGHVAGSRVLRGGGVSHGRLTAYLPVVGMLRTQLSIGGSDDARAIQAKVATFLGTLEDGLSDIGAAILWLLDALPDEDDFRRLDPTVRRRRMLEAVKHVLLRESRVQPLVLAVEDLHWIDGETQALLDSVVENLPTAAALLLVSYRPEYRHRWGGKTYYGQLHVDPLPPESAALLLHALVGHAAERGPLSRQLISTTEGNPLFLEESVRTLVEAGALVGERGGYGLDHSVERFEIPATVQAILAARVDRLAPDDKRILQTAAVIGKDVPTSLLVAIAGVPEEAVLASLERLRASEFLYETRQFPDTEHTFKHALTQEVTYDSVLPESRRALHARIVSAVEQLHAGRLEEHVERLAHHAWWAESWQTASSYASDAGAKAHRRGAARESVALFERGLEALNHLPESRDVLEQGIDLRIGLRGALRTLGAYERSHDYLQQAQVLAARLGDARRSALISAFLSDHFRVIGDPARAIELGEAARATADTLADADLFMLAAVGTGPALFARGHYRRACEVIREAIAPGAHRPTGARIGVVESRRQTVVAMLHRFLVRSLAELGDFSEATSRAEERVRLVEGSDLPNQIVLACDGLGYARLRAGEPTQAIPPLERALSLCRQWSLETLLPAAAELLGSAYTSAGRVDEGAMLLLDAVERGAAQGLMTTHSRRVAALSEAYLVADRRDEAARLAEQALHLARVHDERGHEAWVLKLLGDIAVAGDSSDGTRAEKGYVEALALADRLAMRPLVAHCHMGLATLFRRMQDHARAQDHLTSATTMYREMALHSWLEKTEARALRA